MCIFGVVHFDGLVFWQGRFYFLPSGWRELPTTFFLTIDLNSSSGNYLHCWLLASCLCSKLWILPLSCPCPDGLGCFSSLGFLLSLSLKDLQALLSRSHYNVCLSLVSVRVLQRVSNIMLWPRCRECIASSSAIFFWAAIMSNGTEVSLWWFTAKRKNPISSAGQNCQISNITPPLFK